MTARYCSPEDIRQMVRGTDPNGVGTAAELSDEQLMIAITRASSTVTSYVGTKWEIDSLNPALTVPQMVHDLAAGLASYYATLMYRRGKSLDQYDPVYMMYLDIRTTFRDIASGQVEVDPGRPNEPPEHQGRARNTVPGVFTPRDSGTTWRRGGVGVETGPSGPMPNPWMSGYEQG